jgi:hypothetical protein
MSDYSDLRQAVQAAAEEENAKDCMPEDHEYVVEVNEHASGPALDIWRHEGDERVAPDKIQGPLVQPALDQGWVPRGICRSVNTSLRKGDHVRVFLTEIEHEETFADELADARMEGFAAGLFFATALMGEQSTSTDAMNKEDAKYWLRDYNTFSRGAVIDSENHSDTTGHLYVHAPDTNAEDVEVPDGWYAFEDVDGIAFRPLETYEADHVVEWSAFMDADY